MPKSARRSPASGFTIIELTLVLVIMGLLVVTVLKGATMIHHSKLRKTAQMVEDIRTASNLFLREQGRLPGDDVGTNGQIDSTETQKFTNELINNRYMIGKVGSAWEHPLGGTVSVLYKTTPAAANFIVLKNITLTEDQVFLDQQFDDGVTTTGNVRYVSPDLLIPL